MDCGDPSFSVSAIFHRIFKNDQVAAWLLSREPSPPSVSEQMLKAALTGDMRTMTQNAAKALLEESAGSDWSESSTSVDGAYAQRTTFFGHMGKEKEAMRNEKENEHRQGPKLKPLMKPGNEDGGASLETMTSVCHSISGNYAFITAADSRTPFAFLEPAGEVVPGVRRSIVETSDKDVFGGSCFWKADGRSSMVFFVYPHDFSKPARKCFMLLKPHPPSRYPIESDILEIGWNASRYQCQFCLLRGWDQCECPPSVKERTWPKLPAVDQRDPWSMCLWFYGIFEAGFRKQKIDLYNVSRNIGVSAQIVYHVNPSCLNKDRRRHEYGCRRYLHAIQPVYTRIMLNHRLDDSSVTPLVSDARLLDVPLGNPNNPSHKRTIAERDEICHDQEPACIVEDVLEQQEQQFTEKEALVEHFQSQYTVPGLFVQGGVPLFGQHKEQFDDVTPYISSIPGTVMGQGLNTTISICGTELAELGADENNQERGLASTKCNISQVPAASKRFRGGSEEEVPFPGKKSRADGENDGSSGDPNDPTKIHNDHLGDGVEGRESEIKQAALNFLGEIDQMELHHNTPCSCKICGKGFSRKYDLKRHVMTGHLDIREFVCPICGHKAKRKQHLDIHHQLVHDKESIRATCEVCGKVLVSDFSLKRHMRLVHKSDDTTDKNMREGGPS